MKFAFALLVMVLAASAQAAPDIPPLAALAGVHVGIDTVQALDRQLGPARVTVGGHPRGVHEWRSQQTGWGLHVDGFYYDDRDGRVIDTLSVFRPASDLARLLPQADLPRKKLLFMGVVTLGMSRAEILRLLHAKLPPPERETDKLVWKVEGARRFNSTNHHLFRAWSAKLRFDHDQLSDITLDASQS